MLPIDSPRWKSFRTFFGTPEQVPQRLVSWGRSIGSSDEESQWSKLCEQFLHQLTITEAAYAAVPYVVRELERVETRKRFDYLMDLSLIEAARQRDAGSPPLAPDLADSYHAAVASARRYAVELLPLEWPMIEFRYLMSIVASLYGHGGLGELIFNLDCLCGDCPKCGERFIYPERIQESGYVK